MTEYATFRKLRPDDLLPLEHLEDRAHLQMDPDLGIVCVGKHAWSGEDIAEVVFGEDRTRAYVIEEGKGNLVAYVVYEIEKEGYLIRRLLVDPNYRKCDFGRTILFELYQKLVDSPRRKTLRAMVREDDIATCQWMARMGFKSRLLRQGWDNDLDAVLFEFSTTEHAGSEAGKRIEERGG